MDVPRRGCGRIEHGDDDNRFDMDMLCTCFCRDQQCCYACATRNLFCILTYCVDSVQCLLLIIIQEFSNMLRHEDALFHTPKTHANQTRTTMT